MEAPSAQTQVLPKLMLYDTCTFPWGVYSNLARWHHACRDYIEWLLVRTCWLYWERFRVVVIDSLRFYPENGAIALLGKRCSDNDIDGAKIDQQSRKNGDVFQLMLSKICLFFQPTHIGAQPSVVFQT